MSTSARRTGHDRLPAEDYLLTTDGRSVALRPTRAEDRDAITALVDGLSPDSRAMRFGAARAGLRAEEAAAIAAPPGPEGLALIALAGADRDEAVAVGRYDRRPGEPQAELSLAVADEWQGLGLGTGLIERLLEHGRRDGLEALWHRPGTGASGLRRRAQRRQAGAARGAPRLGASQGRHPGVRAGASCQLPADYARTGQPGFVPGSMGTGSWVLCGQDGSEEASFGSACHGAGRRLSRHAARRLVSGAELRRRLEAQGIVTRCPSSRGLAEEAPLAYKDVDRVVEVIERAGIARRVARLVPLGVLKG